MNKVNETLKKARDLISDEDRWIRGAFAKTGKSGPRVHADGPEARCWCSVGAVINVTDDGKLQHEVLEALGNALKEMGVKCSTGVFDDSVPDFNDRSTHSEVMQMFDKAIEMTK